MHATTCAASAASLYPTAMCASIAARVPPSPFLSAGLVAVLALIPSGSHTSGVHAAQMALAEAVISALQGLVTVDLGILPALLTILCAGSGSTCLRPLPCTLT